MTDIQAVSLLIRSSSTKEEKQAAFTHLYEAHATQMSWAAIKAGSTEPEDVVQSMFASLPLTLLQYDPTRGQVGNYLWKCTYYRAVSEVRQQTARRRRTVHDPQLLSSLNSREPSPDQGMQEAEESESLLSYLDALTPEEREAFTLRYIQGLGVEEIAKQMERSDKQTYRLLHNARTCMRRFVIHQIVMANAPEDDCRLQAMLAWLNDQAYLRSPTPGGNGKATKKTKEIVQILKAHRGGLLLDGLPCHLHWRQHQANSWSLDLCVNAQRKQESKVQEDLLRALAGWRMVIEFTTKENDTVVEETVILDVDEQGRLLASCDDLTLDSPNHIDGVRFRLQTREASTEGELRAVASSSSTSRTLTASSCGVNGF